MLIGDPFKKNETRVMINPILHIRVHRKEMKTTVGQ